MSTAYKLLIAPLAALALGAGACKQDGAARPAGLDGAKIKVVATTGMIADAVTQVGGDRVEVTGLMGPGVDPHLYKASAGDVRRMSEADVVFYSGLHLEGAMAELFEKMHGRVKTVAVAEALDKSRLIAPAGSAGTHDPHVWFDVALWAGILVVIADTLDALDPAHDEEYHERAERYGAAMMELHAYVKSAAARIPERQRVIVTSHDAFFYFGRAYGFEVRGLQGISTAAEAGAADVRALADFIVERQLPAIFVESSVSPRSLEAVREAVAAKGGTVKIGGELFSDAMGNPGTPEGTYLGMVRHNIDTVVKALGGAAITASPGDAPAPPSAPATATP